jgi:hypothetical protein
MRRSSTSESWLGRTQTQTHTYARETKEHSTTTTQTFDQLRDIDLAKRQTRRAANLEPALTKREGEGRQENVGRMENDGATQTLFESEHDSALSWHRHAGLAVQPRHSASRTQHGRQLWRSEQQRLLPLRNDRRRVSEPRPDTAEQPMSVQLRTACASATSSCLGLVMATDGGSTTVLNAESESTGE